MPLEKEFRYYLSHQQDLATRYGGQFIVIKGEDVLGAYPTQDEAILKTVPEHPLGTFLVQFCDKSVESVSQTFHSRVVFG